MEKTTVFDEGPLKIERSNDESGLKLLFSGKSILRDPTKALQPVLLEMLEEASTSQKRLVLDFTGLKYMNSSSFTPIIRALEKSKLEGNEVSVIFSTEKRWQTVSFEALLIFETHDGRIKIEGQ